MCVPAKEAWYDDVRWSSKVGMMLLRRMDSEVTSALAKLGAD